MFIYKSIPIECPECRVRLPIWTPIVARRKQRELNNEIEVEYACNSCNSTIYIVYDENNYINNINTVPIIDDAIADNDEIQVFEADSYEENQVIEVERNISEDEMLIVKSIFENNESHYCYYVKKYISDNKAYSIHDIVSYLNENKLFTADLRYMLNKYSNLRELIVEMCIDR